MTYLKGIFRLFVFGAAWGVVFYIAEKHGFLGPWISWSFGVTAFIALLALALSWK